MKEKEDKSTSILDKKGSGQLQESGENNRESRVPKYPVVGIKGRKVCKA